MCESEDFSLVLLSLSIKFYGLKCFIAKLGAFSVNCTLHSSLPPSLPPSLSLSYPHSIHAGRHDSTTSSHHRDARKDYISQKMSYSSPAGQQTAPDVTTGRDSHCGQPRTICHCQMFPGYSTEGPDTRPPQTESLLQRVH